MEYYMLVRRVTKDILSYPNRPRADLKEDSRIPEHTYTYACGLLASCLDIQMSPLATDQMQAAFLGVDANGCC